MCEEAGSRSFFGKISKNTQSPIPNPQSPLYSYNINKKFIINNIFYIINLII